MDLAYIFSGLLVGFIVGLTGVGGGSLMTPLLMLVFGIPPAIAVGTDLLYAALTKTGGAIVHGFNKTVDWKITGLLAIGSIPAALITVGLLHYLKPDSAFFSTIISTALGIALILTALALLFKQHLLKIALRNYATQHDWRTKRVASVTIVTGVVLGILVTISSVGAGALGAAALVFLYPRLSIVKVVGSDIAHAVPLTLVAGLGHAFLGTVNFGLLGSLLIGSLPGIFLGSHLSAKVPERILRPILALMLIIIGGRLVF